MLEHTATRESEVLKPVPVVEKVDYSGAHEKTDPREIALVKKLDRWIMPMLWSMYWLVCPRCFSTTQQTLTLTQNYLDRNAIALARLDDLEEDLNLSSTQYQTCVSILFVGYLLGQVKYSRSSLRDTTLTTSRSLPTCSSTALVPVVTWASA